jgi:hypothetical protein
LYCSFAAFIIPSLSTMSFTEIPAKVALSRKKYGSFPRSFAASCKKYFEKSVGFSKKCRIFAVQIAFMLLSFINRQGPVTLRAAGTTSPHPNVINVRVLYFICLI